MKQRFNLIHLLLSALAGALALALVLTLFLGVQGLSLLTAWGAVKLTFVGEYDPATAANYALSGLVYGLGDRWSYYLDAESSRAQKVRRENTYVGMGVTVAYDEARGLVLQAVVPDGPAEKAGLKRGEIITAIGEDKVTDLGHDAALAALRGEVGTVVALTVQSETGEERQVEVALAAVPNPTVRSAMLPGKVGYVAVANFYTYSASQLKAAVADLQAQGAAALVFDMRNNGGGYVAQLTDMLDYLLPAGPIFRSRNAWGWEEVTQSDENYVNLPMAVLVNGDTYSAAELFAAQLQETAGAYIVGVETSGKGYAQKSVYLPNGGDLNLSMDRYTTGAGVSLVGTGVTLDARVELTEEEEVLLRAKALPYDEDPQLQKALELLG